MALAHIDTFGTPLSTEHIISKMKLTTSLSVFLMLTVASGLGTLPSFSEVAPLSVPRSNGPYHGFNCKRGSAKPDAIINCLPVLEQLRRSPPEPRSFGYKVWQDKPNGCRVAAVKVGPSEATIVVPDLPNDLIFLLYRCYLMERSSPSPGAIINAGQDLMYRLEITPPPLQQIFARIGGPSFLRLPRLPSVAPTKSSSSPQFRLSLPTATPSLGGRTPPECVRSPDQVEGAFSDCVSALLEMLNTPGSDEPKTWQRSDGRQWYVHNCVVRLEPPFSRGEDVFSVRSLIYAAMWILGTCFAGPEESKRLDYGEVAVGPLKMCKLVVAWGFGSGELDGIVGAANRTKLLSSVATIDSPGVDTAS